MVLVWFCNRYKYRIFLSRPTQIRKKILIVKKTLIIFYGIIIFNAEICYLINPISHGFEIV